MHPPAIARLFAASLAWGALLAGAGSAADFQVVDANGEPACKVVLRPEATPPEKTACELLVDTIERSTGAKLEVAGGDGAAGEDAPAVHLRVREEGLKDKTRTRRHRDGFSVDVTPDRVVILGNNPESVIYGAASFLERFVGARWLAPGDLWTVVPRRAALTVPAGAYSEAPGFPIRAVHITGVQEKDGKRYAHWHFAYADWAMRNRINRKYEHVGRYRLLGLMNERGLSPLRGGHSLAHWLPNQPFHEEHPEYYAFNGECRVQIRRGGTQLNYSSAEMREVFARRALEHVRTHPQVDILGISLNDGYGFSVDVESRSEWFHDGNGMPIVSNSVFGFSNRVAQVVAREFPGVVVQQLAYTPYYHEPPRFALHPNFGVKFTMYRGSSVTPMCEAANESDRKMRRELEQWRAKTANIVVGEYLTPYWHDAMFASGVRMIAKDIQWYREMGFQGVATEYGQGQKTAREMFYAYARMLWNPDQDFMELVRDFYAAAYGRAAETMLAAYDEYWRAAQACGCDAVGTRLAVALSNVPGFHESMLTRLAEAPALAEREEEKARILQVRQEFEAFMARAGPYASYEHPLPAATPDNLLDPDNAAPNPSFEEELRDWRFSRKAAGAKAAVTETVAWHGKRSVALVAAPEQRHQDAKWSTVIPVAKGELYRVHVMVKPDRAAIESHSILLFHASGLDLRKGKTCPALLIDDWRPLGFLPTIAKSDKLGIVVRLYAGAGAWYVDGLRVQRMPKKKP